MSIEDLQIVWKEAYPSPLPKGKGGQHVLWTGLYASARALMLARVQEPMFIVLDNAESAQYLFSDLRSLTAGAERPLSLKDRSAVGPQAELAVGSNVFFFPAAQRRRTTDEAARVQRTETLTALTSERVNE